LPWCWRAARWTKAIAVILVGILLSTVGTDLESGEERLDVRLERDRRRHRRRRYRHGHVRASPRSCASRDDAARDVVHAAIGICCPNAKDLRIRPGRSRAGTFLGGSWVCCPATARCSGPFASYTAGEEARQGPLALRPGAIEGVADRSRPTTPGAQTAFIPLLTLGIPPNAVMALMVGAMTIHGIVPGPQIMTKQPQLFWGMIASMWIGNLMLLVINLPLIGLWVRFLKVPYRLMFPAIVLLCCIGIYSINNSPSR
jgi:putative tricarboxylic transport membrane protein